MPQYFIHVQYCYNFLVDQIPMSLLLYSHIPTALFALIFTAFVLFKARDFRSFLLFLLSVLFTIWAAFDLSAWFAFLGHQNTMFTWSLLDVTAVLMFFIGYYFLYVFVTGKDLPLWQKIAGILLLVPTATVAVMGLNIPTYDLNTCTALENSTFTRFTYVAEAIFLLTIITFIIREYRKAADRLHKMRALLAGIGLLFFTGFLFSASLLVSLLASTDASSYVYNYLIYGLFGMPIFIAYLGYLIVRYKAFDLRIIGAQGLVLALIALIASEFAFIDNDTNRILVGVTLVLTAFVGTQLIRGVRREIEQRQHIQKLATDLEKANEAQVNLIHFITHQIKGFVTKSRNIFSMALEGDFGEVNGQLRPMLQEGFNSDTKGAEMIQQILNAANIRLGKIEYRMAPLDVKSLIEDAVKLLSPNAEKKGLKLNASLGDAPAMISGDKDQLNNVFRNLIDNSIKYTPSGEVNVALEHKDGKILFSIKDTGVGISEEDKKVLFTEGGHGKDSTKVNVESTGYGLYIVKQIVEGHKGRVWAESEGPNKGSQFYVELPAQ